MKTCWIWMLGLVISANSGCAGTWPLRAHTAFKSVRPPSSHGIKSIPQFAENHDEQRTPATPLAGQLVATTARPNRDVISKVTSDPARHSWLESEAANEQVDRSTVIPVSFSGPSEFQDEEIRTGKQEPDSEQSGAANGNEPSAAQLEEDESKQTDDANQAKNDQRDVASPPRPPLESFQTPSATGYTLADIEQLAITNNPALAAAQAAICKATGLKQQVGILPNPTLGYFGQQLADQGTAQNGLFVERIFVRGDKLRLNREVLAHTTCAQVRELEAQQYRVLTDVRIRFYEAIAAQQQLAAARSLQAAAQRGVEIAADRMQAEEGSRIEVLQSETLLSEITLSVERTEIAYRAAWKDLAAIAGLSETTASNLVGDLASTNGLPNWDELYSQIVQQSPELSVARELVSEKAAMLRRQQVQAIPNVTGQLGAGYDSATDNGMINVQVSAPIPVTNRNRGNISAANADYMQAVENVRRIEQSLKSRMARVAQDYESSLAAVNKYEDEIIPQSSQGLELSEEAYQAGELDFLQVLILRRSYFEAMIRCIEFKLQLAQATAKLDGLLLTGALEAPQDFTDGDGIRGTALDGL